MMVFTGDGGFQMTALCVVTQTRYGLNPIIFVIDNGNLRGRAMASDGAVVLHPADRLQKDWMCTGALTARWQTSLVTCKGWNVDHLS